MDSVTRPPVLAELAARIVTFVQQHPYLAALAVLLDVLVFAAAWALETRTRRIRRLPRLKPPTSLKEAKRRAKLENERVKLTSSFLNGTAIAVLLTNSIIPIFKRLGDHPDPVSWPQALAGITVAFGLHASALGVLGLWRSEE